MKPFLKISFSLFQEQMRHIRSILIDEMSFIGPKFFMQIDSTLREAFLENKTYPFGGRSIILVGDLRQLPPVKDKSIYVGNTASKFLCNEFKVVAKLDVVF